MSTSVGATSPVMVPAAPIALAEAPDFLLPRTIVGLWGRSGATEMMVLAAIDLLPLGPASLPIVAADLTIEWFSRRDAAAGRSNAREGRAGICDACSSGAAQCRCGPSTCGAAAASVMPAAPLPMSRPPIRQEGIQVCVLDECGATIE